MLRTEGSSGTHSVQSFQGRVATMHSLVDEYAGVDVDEKPRGQPARAQIVLELYEHDDDPLAHAQIVEQHRPLVVNGHRPLVVSVHRPLVVSGPRGGDRTTGRPFDVAERAHGGATVHHRRGLISSTMSRESGATAGLLGSAQRCLDRRAAAATSSSAVIFVSWGDDGTRRGKRSENKKTGRAKPNNEKNSCHDRRYRKTV